MKIKRDSEKFRNKESNKIIKKSELNYGQYAICTFIVLALLISCFSGIFFNEKTTDDSNPKNIEKSENISEEEINEIFKNQKNLQEEQINEKINENLESMKCFFTKNQGQLENDEIYFTYSSQDKTFGFSESSVLIKLTKKLDANTKQSSIIKLTFENSNKVIPIGKEELNHKSNYFIGNNSLNWKSNIPNYKKVVFKNLYDGIDLVYYFNEKGLKYDWIVKAYADPNKIVERFEGIDSINTDSDGDLIINTEAGEYREEKPYSYQEIHGKERVECSLKLIENSLIYEIGDYETSEDLVIDPLIYSTYVGGGSFDHSFSFALDSENNSYITGSTKSSDFPITSGCYDDSHNEIFVFKLNWNGSSLLYSTYVGGNGNENGNNIVLDFKNNVYVTGRTNSSNFPTTSGCYDNSFNGGNGDVFVFKLNWNGTKLIYSTFIGGGSYDKGFGIALDTENNAYITGCTKSSNFPTTPACFDDSHNGKEDVFVFKLNQEGSNLVYSTFVGGNNQEGYCTSVAVDSEKNAYITGYTKSSNFPTTLGCFDDLYNGERDVFVFELNPDGSDLLYSTYIGGTDDDNSDYSRSIILDSENNAYITGDTRSSDFPITLGCFDDTLNGTTDVYVFKLNSDGSNLLYSTFLGGNSYDKGIGITLDSLNNAYITGGTSSKDFPTTPGCYDNSFNGGEDIFVCKLNSEASDLLYSTYVGGGHHTDRGFGILLDSENNAYISGFTSSSDFPTTSGCYDDSHNGEQDVFVLKLNFTKLKVYACIDTISPNPANEGEKVYFYGNGSTEDGTIIGYRWYSNIDGLLSDKKSFTISNLSNGTHKIYFKVENSTGVWSDENSTLITVNGIPRTKIDEISPNFANEGDSIMFIGDFIDFENSILEYYWESDIDGILSDKKSFTSISLSNGTHTISFRVKDNYEAWSEEVFAPLTINGIPRPKIDEITPNPANEGEDIWFYGNGTDDGTIEYYEWRSNIDGILSNEKVFTLLGLSNGTHTISFKVRDNNGVWSDEVTVTLVIESEIITYPDLKITNENIILSKENPLEGQKIRIYATIINLGNTDAKANVTFYLDKISSTNQIGSKQPISVLAGKTDDVYIDWICIVGEHKIYAKITNSVPEESDTSNNIAYKSINVQKKIKEPDLILTTSDIWIEGTLKGKETVKIKARIHNYGDIEAIAKIKIYDGEAKKDESNLIGFSTISILPNGNYTTTEDWTPLTKGNHTIYVIIENCDPMESNTQNNQATKTVFVEPDDKKEKSYIPSSETMAVGATIGVCAIVAFVLIGTEIGLYKLLILVFLPLYFKITRKDIEKRLNKDKFTIGRIYQYINSNPGATFSEIKRAIDSNNGSTAYHLNRLEKIKNIKSERDGQYRRFYLNGVKISDVPKKLTQIQQQILKYIYENPGITIDELAIKLNLSRQNLSYHLRILKNSEIPYVKYVKKDLKNHLYVDIESEVK